MKVLLVDDEIPFLKQAQIFLEKENDRLDIETSTSAIEALNSLEDEDYDAIVSDYKMPKMNGIEFLETLRKENNDIPFIILTGKGHEEAAMRALNLGANHYLMKEGDPKSLHKALSQVITQEVNHWRTNKKLDESRKELQLLLDSAPAMIFYLNKDGKMVRINQTLADSLGMPKEEIEGKRLGELFPEEIAEKMLQDNQEVIESGKPKLDIIEQYDSPDGTTWTQTDKIPLKDEDGNIDGVLGFSIDITERRKAEEELRESKERLSQIIQNTAIPTFVIDSNHTVTHWNKACENLTGCSANEMIGTKKAWSAFYDEERPVLADLIIEEASKNKLAQYYGDNYRENELIEKAFEAEGFFQKTDGEGRWLSITAAPIKNPRGKTVAAIEMLRDTTEREEAREKSEFLHSLLIHDLRNKTQITRGYLELLEDTELSKEQEEMVERATKASQEEVGLIEKTKTVKEIKKRKPTGLPLDLPLSNAISRNELRASEKGIEIDYESSECKVMGGPLLEELFSNLIENSILHSGCDKIKISVQEENMCTVSVEDDGGGVPDHVRARAFERSFSGKSSRGSGLGLYLVKEVAEHFGGSVELKDSELGGARFDVHLVKA